MSAKPPPLVRTELALVLVALSLVAPRLIGKGSTSRLPQVPSELSSATVSYAEERLWSDFLKARSELVKSWVLPEPTLPEYRHFLAGLGLRKRGDVATLFVLPAGESQLESEAIEVQLAEAHPPLVLRLIVKDEANRERLAGHLQIRADAKDVVTCWAEVASENRLLSFWPLRPGPVLP
jgi:hypothetical protein